MYLHLVSIAEIPYNYTSSEFIHTQCYIYVKLITTTCTLDSDLNSLPWFLGESIPTAYKTGPSLLAWLGNAKDVDAIQ